MTTSGPAAEQHTTRVNPRPGRHQSGREALAGLPRSEGLKAPSPRGWQSPPGAAPPADGPPSAPAPRRQRPHAGCGRGDISPSTSLGRRRVARLAVQNDIIGIMPDASGMDGGPLTETIVSEQCALPQHRIHRGVGHPGPQPISPRARQGKIPAFRAGPSRLGSLHQPGTDGVGQLRAGRNSFGTCPPMSSTPWLSRDDGSTDASGPCRRYHSAMIGRGRVTPRSVPGGRNRGASP